ncbi:MAG: YciI family protein [Burkholderiales bacterium]|nr:YciI family protein [Burkholderiales bacterium]
MPYFALFGTDKPGMLDVRLATRPSHRAYLHDPTAHDVKVLHGGPTAADDGVTMNGSLLVVEAESLDAVRRFAAGDPYAKAGIFERMEIRPWLWATGRPAP